MDAYTSALDEAVPHWAELDNDPLFIAWLTHEDDSTGMLRQKLLRTAAAELNPKPIIRLMRQFEQENGAVAHAPTPPVVPSGSGASAGQPAAPGVTTAQLPPTRAEIREHYKKLAIKRGYDGSEEAKAMDARIKAASAAGTLR